MSKNIMAKCRCCNKRYIEGDEPRNTCPHCGAKVKLPEMCACGCIFRGGKCPRLGCTENN
jgi:hypothetical protein